MSPRLVSVRRFVTRLLGFALITGCLSDSVEYSPERDDEAMEAIAQRWSGSAAGGLSLSLCEDVAAPEDDNTCQVEHVVRGGGLGRRHEESRGNGGCGGCPFANVAYVKGTVSGGMFATPTEIVGEVSLDFEDGANDPYAYPFYLDLRCTSTTEPCSIGARLLEDGTIEVIDPTNYEVVMQTLTPEGPASCP